VFPPSKFSGAPILCYVTDRKGLVGDTNEQNNALLKRITAAAEAGIDWIQIREKDLSGKELSLLTRAAVAQTKQMNEHGGQASRILVNERVDVALSERTGGVHLGENSLRVGNVRKWLDEKPELAKRQEFPVGVSCHSLEAAMAAARDGADYIFFGPVFATPSKAAFGAPQGLKRLDEVCSSVKIPVLGIGGITTETASNCLAAGAAGIAAIRLFQDAENLASLVSHLRGSPR
jgi:thiamine-phosphate pyrophosphorylase